jgi:hypothetical protein
MTLKLLQTSTVSTVKHDLGRTSGELPFAVEGYLRVSHVLSKTASEHDMMHMGH